MNPKKPAAKKPAFMNLAELLTRPRVTEAQANNRRASADAIAASVRPAAPVPPPKAAVVEGKPPVKNVRPRGVLPQPDPLGLHASAEGIKRRK